jgi:hypothetical protein
MGTFVWSRTGRLLAATAAPERTPGSVSELEPRVGGALELEEGLAIVPVWLLDASISDCAVRLYAILLRYGQSSGTRMPSRATLAMRLKKRSTDTVDRSMRELVDLGAVQVCARYAGRERLTNQYLVRASRPTPTGSASPSTPSSSPTVTGGGRKFAATRTSAAHPRVPYREHYFSPIPRAPVVHGGRSAGSMIGMLSLAIVRRGGHRRSGLLRDGPGLAWTRPYSWPSAAGDGRPNWREGRA